MFKTRVNFLLICSLLLLSAISAAPFEPENDSKSSEEDTVSAIGDFFRDVGSSIQSGVKTVGKSVQKGYEYVKLKVASITDDADSNTSSKGNATSTSTTSTTSTLTSTETIKLAGEADPVTPNSVDTKAKSIHDIDDRFLFDAPMKCPDGQLPDHTNHCRTA